MINHIESLSEVQEEHPTGTSIVNLPIYCRKKFNETGDCGVSLSEPRLAIVEDVMVCKITRKLGMGNPVK